LRSLGLVSLGAFAVVVVVVIVVMVVRLPALGTSSAAATYRPGSAVVWFAVGVRVGGI